MPDYKLHFLTSSDDIATTKEFECAGDEQAIDHALQLGDGRKLELWSGDILVRPALLRERDLDRRGFSASFMACLRTAALP
jgi:hypothetical protein